MSVSYTIGRTHAKLGLRQGTCATAKVYDQVE